MLRTSLLFFSSSLHHSSQSPSSSFSHSASFFPLRLSWISTSYALRGFSRSRVASNTFSTTNPFGLGARNFFLCDSLPQHSNVNWIVLLWKKFSASLSCALPLVVAFFQPPITYEATKWRREWRVDGCVCTFVNIWASPICESSILIIGKVSRAHRNKTRQKLSRDRSPDLLSIDENVRVQLTMQPRLK